MAHMTLHMDHIALPAYDAAATYRFYAEVMGLPLVTAMSGDNWGGKPWLMMVFATGDRRQIALTVRRGVRRPARAIARHDIPHFAFAAGSIRQLGSWKRRLAVARIRVREEDHGDQRSLYFIDPNGTLLEVTSPASARKPVVNRRAVSLVTSWAGNQWEN
jgi:catechol 2,3-dioxygenase-like lactoylglutathione lyase family enzyme